jgi:16S rRNA (cytosine967-C5)-methyltransferase
VNEQHRPRRSGSSSAKWDPRRGPRPRPPKPPRTARRVALDALLAVDRGDRANLVLADLLGASDLEQRDRGFVTELVYGTCRMQRACDWLADHYVKGGTDSEVRAALRLGTYQLAFLRVPSHAAVSATVEEVKGPGRKLVNAVLRRVADELERGPVRWPDPAIELSYPDWIVARLGTDLGPERARAAMEIMNTPAEVTERADGYIQDRASQMVATHVGRAPGERILDLCAAPGGKATALAGGEGQRPALVVAADISLRRMEVIAANTARLELANVSAVVADGLKPAWREGSFDRVLVDAPCSGLGVLRRRPDARWRIQPADVSRLADLQQRLLEAAIPLVRPGGVLVYSVCTLTRAETAMVDRWLAEAHPELVPLPPPGDPWIPAGRGGLLVPQAAGTDGMFVLTLRRPGGPTVPPS